MKRKRAGKSSKSKLTAISIKKKAAKKTAEELIVEKEVQFTRLLASNEERIRAKVLKGLKQWLTVRCKSSYGFAEADFLRIWKGLYYYMWMSDKPLVQEEVAESISQIVHCFNSAETALLYTKSTYRSLSVEWYGIDKFRIDKFEMLARRILRQTFVMCKKNNWDMNVIKKLSKIFEELLTDSKSSMGLIYHLINIFMEEYAKISKGETFAQVTTELVRPFVLYLVSRDDDRTMKAVVEDIFRYLILQSDAGIEYQQKFEAWRQAGFPCESIDEIQKVEVSDSQDELVEDDEDAEKEKKVEKPLDPRAGHVDVELPQVTFDAQEIAGLLEEYKFHRTSTTKGRMRVARLIEEFKVLAKGKMPLGIKNVEVPKKPNYKVMAEEAVLEMMNFEDDLYQDSSKRAKRKRNNQVSMEENGLGESSSKKMKSVQNRVAKPVKNQFIVDDFEAPNEIPAKKKRFSTAGSWDVSNVEATPEASTKVESPKPKRKGCQNNVVPVPESKKSPQKKSPSKSLVAKVTASPEKKKSPEKVIAKVTASPEKMIAKATASLKKEKSPEKMFKTPPKKTLLQTLSQSEPKKVKIMLNKNTAQNTSEYLRTLRQKPSIPYDANRRPTAGVLKPNLLPSPINPFYKISRRSL